MLGNYANVVVFFSCLLLKFIYNLSGFSQISVEIYCVFFIDNTILLFLIYLNVLRHNINLLFLFIFVCYSQFAHPVKNIAHM